MTFALTGPAFAPHGPIPLRFTREGANISPPIEWHDAPPATRSFALIVEDPDAPRGTFRHWIAYDIRDSMAPRRPAMAPTTSGLSPSDADKRAR
jgi:phosphatidylethanolamine-binding protein (PEBP) family uncharacterized protein